MPGTPVPDSITEGDFLTEVITAQARGFSHAQKKMPLISNQAAKPHNVNAARR